MWEEQLETNVISDSAGISSCEKDEQWQRTLALISEMHKEMVEPHVVSYSPVSLRSSRRCAETTVQDSQLQCWRQLALERWAVAAYPVAAERDVGVPA
mmetsp:Transcript_62527/g.168641  ORF Transcript_62527/g.168641 Transcript_62527/m.168641 type:complete len:98 (+) Transcript_62527:407-700(+)